MVASSVAAMARTSLYFVPLRLPDQKELYLAARREGWMASHGTMDCFDGDAFLSAAQRSYDFDPESVLIAMCQDRPVGMLHLDFQVDDLPAAAAHALACGAVKSPQQFLEDQGVIVFFDTEGHPFCLFLD